MVSTSRWKALNPFPLAGIKLLLKIGFPPKFPLAGRYKVI